MSKLWNEFIDNDGIERCSRTAYDIAQAFGQLEYDTCVSVGIMGRCGLDCPVYQKRKCEISEEINEEL